MLARDRLELELPVGPPVPRLLPQPRDDVGVLVVVHGEVVGLRRGGGADTKK